jgi:MarR family transcriptional regulator, multiple antibiotic resistance protein MarR
VASIANPGPARLFDDLVRCETRIYNALNDALRQRHGIVTSQFEFLRFIRDHPNTRVADIAANFAIGIGATSKAMDRLESKGLLQRLPNPDDRRSSLLALSAGGTRLADEAEATFDASMAAFAADLSPAQLAAASEGLAVLRATLERDGIGAPVG